MLPASCVGPFGSGQALRPTKNAGLRLTELALLAFAYGAVGVAHFVAFEVFDVVDGPCGVLTARWNRALVPVVRMEMIIDVAMKACGAVEPGADADENASGKPLGPVVAIGSAVIGCDGVVAIGTFRRDADFDGDLGLGFGRAYGETEGSYCCQQQQG